MNTLATRVLEYLPHDVFTDRDVFNLFPGTDQSRYAIVKRAIASKEIIKIRRGLYCLATKFQRKGVNPYPLSNQIYGPSYVSLESALSYHGWIPEAVFTTTSVSKKKSADFKTPLGLFSFTHIPLKVFYAGVNHVSDSNGQSFFMATPLKALADYIYTYKKNWTNLVPVVEGLRIDVDEILKAPRDHFLIYKNYNSRRVINFFKGILRELNR